MKVTVLVDNNTLIDRYYLGEPGVAYFIEEGENRILFDTGYSDVFLKNALKMKLPLGEIDFVAISHGHNDHTWGLGHLVQWLSENQAAQKPTLVAHPCAFYSKRVEEVGEIGSLLSLDVLQRQFSMLLSRQPVWLTERLVFLGEIPRGNGFENKTPVGSVENGSGREPDFSLDDSALAYKGENGLVIITGCSHAGICNTVDYAKLVCEETRLQDVIGGFHLLDSPPEILEQTCAHLKKQNVKILHAAHCTDLAAKIRLAQNFTLKEVGVGLVLEYD
ncbi:MBL fold metallo-hydrolase [Azotosporobacter soli]|uniref:MBL fold metallo-hydrolase n=1 Tax=Azotosporobacter soli TaxID=3055040 RepID=UPI0031FF36E9